MINFVHNCTMYDLVDGTLDPKTFAQSNSLWSLMNTTNPARFTNVWNYGTSSYDVLTCKDAYTALNTRLPGAVSEARAKIAFAINAARDDTAAVGLIDTQLEAAYAKNRINSTALAAADILRQNMLINAVMDAGLMGSTKLNDPTDQETTGRVREYAQRASSDEQFRLATVSRQGDSQSINAQFSNARKHMEQAAAEFARGMRLQETARFGNQSRDGMSYNWIEDPRNAELVRDLVRETRGMSPGQAQIHIENRLAERGLLSHPTKYMSGAPVLWSEQQLREDFSAARDASELREDLRARNRQNQSSINGIEASPVEMPQAFRDKVATGIEAEKREVGAKQRAISKVHSAAHERFEQQSGVKADRDGPFGSKNSTADRAARNAWEDGKRSADNFLDAVEDETFGSIYRLLNGEDKKGREK